MANTNQNTIYQARFDTLATISRRSNEYHRFSSRMIDNRREPYPTNLEIQRRASNRANRFKEIGYLSKKDIVWSAAIHTDIALDRRSRQEATRRDTFLEDLIEVGLYDRTGGEVRNDAEETSMRYTSACTSAVMDHVVRLESRVGNSLL